MPRSSIDGIVATYNDVAYAKSCGRTGHHYKDGLAFKFEDERFETKRLGGQLVKPLQHVEGLEGHPAFPAVLGFQQPGPSLLEMEAGIQKLRDFARDKDIPIDGIVATYNDVAYAKSCGRRAAQSRLSQNSFFTPFSFNSRVGW